MKTGIKKLLSLLLAFVLVLQAIPVSAFATTPETAVSPTEEATHVTETSLLSDVTSAEAAYVAAMEAGDLFIPDHPEIEREVYELRTATEKHFQMTDGTYTVVSYGYPVHFFEDGVWKDYSDAEETLPQILRRTWMDHCLRIAGGGRLRP